MYDLDQLSCHGYTIENILANEEFTGVPRAVQVAEIFSGVGSIHKAAKKKHIESVDFDQQKEPGVTDTDGAESEDFLTFAGFTNAIKILMSIVPGGLFFLAPWCGPWMYLNKKNTKRKKSNSYWGDDSYEPVKLSNLMMTGVCILMAVAAKRSVIPCMENPVKSYVWHWPPLVALMEKLGLTSISTFRCAFERCKEPKIWKKFRFAAKGSWIKKLIRKCKCQKEHLRTSRVHYIHGQKRCTGIASRLKLSGAYPTALGTAMVAAWMKFGSVPEKEPKGKAQPKKKLRKSKKKLQTTRCSSVRKVSKQKADKPKRAPKTKPVPKKEVSSNGPSWLTPTAGVMPSPKAGAVAAKNAGTGSSWLQPTIAQGFL